MSRLFAGPAGQEDVIERAVSFYMCFPCIIVTIMVEKSERSRSERECRGRVARYFYRGSNLLYAGGESMNEQNGRVGG